MYTLLLLVHGYLRWLVLLSLLWIVGLSVRGWLTNRPYSRADGAARVLTTTITHTQFLLGIGLYTVSPIINAYFGTANAPAALSFFAIRHALTMLTAVVVMTVGSSLTKRASNAPQQFRLTTIYFGIGLLLILSVIPWPFLEHIGRPWLR